MAGPFLLGVIEQDRPASGKRRAVIEEQGGAGGESGHLPVPHHPAAGGEVEQAVAGAHIAVQDVLLEMLQKDAAVAMYDAFGYAGGAGGIHDEQRVGEGQRRENDAFVTVRQVFPGRQWWLELRCVRQTEIGHQHDACQRRQLRHDFGVFGPAIDLLAVVPVAVDTEQHLGCNLAKTVEYALDAEVRRSGGPDGAQRRGGEHGCQCFR